MAAKKAPMMYSPIMARSVCVSLPSLSGFPGSGQGEICTE